MTKRELRKNGFAVISRLFESLSEHGYERVMYRGHGNKGWDLAPSIFRDGTLGIRDRKRLEKWISAASRFAQPPPQSDVEWLVLAQHYGVATALLDWTINPLIALFFAAETAPYRNGSVLMASRNAFTEWIYLQQIDPFAKNRIKPGLITASTMNTRAGAQDSVMSLHTENYRNEIPENLVKKIFEVRMSEKLSVIEAMNTLGYTRERVYSDITMLVERFIEEKK